MADRKLSTPGLVHPGRGSLTAAGITALASFSTVATIGFLGSGRVQAETFPLDSEPANPEAMPAARDLKRRLCEISGRYTLTGQQNFPEDLARCSNRVSQLTGRYPAIFGQDFGFADFDGRRARMIAEVVRQHRQGAVPALTWHAPSPASYERSVQSKLTDKEWSELLTPGSVVYNRWTEQVDEIAGYLSDLGRAGVPVLFRPYHEINARWFWWNGRLGERGSVALYRQLYERYVRVHRLNNLLWVWNVNAPGLNVGRIERYYPGPQYVDVVTMDNYRSFRRSYYEQMLALAADKPIALAEVGRLPRLQVLRRQPRWAYFMIWRGFEETANSPERLRAMFEGPNVLSRSDTRFTATVRDADLPLVEPL